MKNWSVKFLILSILAVFILPITSSSQISIDVPFSLSNELGVEIIPNYPKPNEEVSVNLSLYTGDLNSADIAWYENNKLVLSGKGETSFSFKTRGVGEEIKIEIKIKLLNGSAFSKSFTINPAGVYLVWEANSYVPPFYKGKALHPRQGSLKVVAMPEFVKNGKRVPAKNLVYEWSNGINVLQNQSGYGKNVLVLNGSILGRAEDIEVLVTDPVNNLVAQSFVDIAPIAPEIVFYENNLYYGHIFDIAIKNSWDLKSEEVQILAAPYYFTNENNNSLQYSWRLNSQSVPNLAGSRTAVFRKPEGESGQSSISLQIENIERILQQADRGLTINFDN